jgi:phosphoribosylformylglycinamidine synthase
MTTKPVTLVIRTAGTNCDRELAHAFEAAGAQVVYKHLTDLIQDPSIFQTVDLVGFPGGFSYGDDIAAGRIFANRLRHKLMNPILAAIDRGVPMIGICNGFQVMVKLGLLPEPHAGRQTSTLADNLSGRFTDKWVSLDTVPDTVCIWTKGLPKVIDLPIAHGEGRFVPESNEALNQLKANRQIALRYSLDGSAAFPGNPNGSTDNIAGLCDKTGLVLGLMPHPERNTHPTNHPHWTRKTAEALAQTPAGLRFFENAVQFVQTRKPVAV